MIRICRSLYDIFLSSEGSLLSSIGILLGNLQKDTQYRIREKIFETLGKLGVHFVRIKLFFNFLYFKMNLINNINKGY